MDELLQEWAEGDDQALFAGGADLLGELPPLASFPLPATAGLLDAQQQQQAPAGLAAAPAAPTASSAAAAAAVGHPAQPADAQSRLEAERARNREKQARFRQRQKERRAELEAAHEQAATDLERERALHEQLLSTGAMLEAVKLSKDAAVDILQAAGGAAPQQQQQQAALPAPGWAQQQQQQQPPQPPPQQQQPGGSGAGGTAGAGAALAQKLFSMPFAQRVELCGQLFRGSHPARLALRQAGRRPDGFALQLDVRQEVGQHMAADHPQVLEAALHVTDEMALLDWRQFGELAARLVSALDAGELSPAEAEDQLQPATVYQAIQHAIWLTHNPGPLRALVAHTRWPGESEADAEARWRRVAVEDMAVTEAQARAVLPIYREHRHQAAQLASEAAESLATLQRLQQSLSAQLLDSGLSASSLAYLRLFEASGALCHQPVAALHSLMHFTGRAGAVVSPLQKARMVAAAPGLYCDVEAIVRGSLAHFGLLDAAEAAAADE